jgi:hypothetical protein
MAMTVMMIMSIIMISKKKNAERFKRMFDKYFENVRYPCYSIHILIRKS